MKSRHHLVILDVSDAVLVRELKRIIEQVIANIMGMSDDFEDAINAGATHIRIGTAIFGKRE